MTDNEIIKAWEWHTSPVINGRMKIYSAVVECSSELANNTLDLINRQKAEIERLHKAIKVQDIMIEQQDYKLKTAKSEAIKEFAERLTDKICENVNKSLDNPNGYDYYPMDVYADIDNLLKEMVGDSE